MLFRNSPQFAMFFLIWSILIFLFMFILNGSGLISMPPITFKVFFTVWAFIFLWWPIDLIIHWDKRTEAEITKDRIIACLSAAIIIFIYPYYFLGFPFWPTLWVSILVGFFIPGLFGLISATRSRLTAVDPGHIYRASTKSQRYQEFMRYFPNAKQYVMGFTAGDGDRGHVMLHHRQPYNGLQDSYIDYILDICVDKKLGSHIGGQEKLQCYLFKNDGVNAGVGFLPCSNIGRALDYGFSDEEMERAVAEVTSMNQNWAALSNDPIPIQHYHGRFVRMK